MTDSIQDQAAAIVASTVNGQIGSLAIDSDTVEVREGFDWDDIAAMDGITVHYGGYVEWPDGTNEREVYGHQFYVVATYPRDQEVDPMSKATRKLMENVRRTFHNKRTMASVSSTGTNQLPTTVKQGPRPPKSLQSRRVHTLTVTAWFVESRTVVA